MPRTERIHEGVAGLPAPEYFADKAEHGWQLVGMEWQREVSEEADASTRLHEVPFGFRIAADCKHLEDNQEEKRALTTMMELIVSDCPLSQVAQELNNRGFRTRREALWTPVDVFKLLPRLVESGPAIFTSPAWIARKQGAASGQRT